MAFIFLTDTEYDIMFFTGENLLISDFASELREERPQTFDLISLTNILISFSILSIHSYSYENDAS